MCISVTKVSFLHEKQNVNFEMSFKKSKGGRALSGCKNHAKTSLKGNWSYGVCMLCNYNMVHTTCVSDIETY